MIYYLLNIFYYTLCDEQNDQLYFEYPQALRDYTSLEQELLLAEKTLIEVMNQERIAEARFIDRAKRPSHELAKDDVNRKLRQEQTQLKTFGKQLRNNINRIRLACYGK